MDGGNVPPRVFGLVPKAYVGYRTPNAIALIGAQLGAGPFDLVVLFVAPGADFRAIVGEAEAVFAGTKVVACTTAGEICDGYRDDTIVAVAFPSALFCSRTLAIPDVRAVNEEALVADAIATRNALAAAAPEWTGEFDFLLVDGMSTREDQLVAALSAGLGSVPLVGGSAGDGTRFKETAVASDGEVHLSGAVLVRMRTACRVKVFKTDHLRPSNIKMVVTEADPERRVVRQINAEPAAREYARILGKDPEQLTTFTFAAHPVVVRMGGQHHVRAIQRVTDEGDLVFFCAIDEGMVLTLADAEDMVGHLDRELCRLSDGEHPDLVLACDCILRRKEAEQKQIVHAISDILRRHKVVGFSTYGEQIHFMHVNQTLTGVAIYPPRS